MEETKTKVACFTFGVVQGVPQGWGNWAKVRYLFGFFSRFSAENDYGTVHISDKFFESTVRRQNLEILTEHKPA